MKTNAIRRITAAALAALCLIPSAFAAEEEEPSRVLGDYTGAGTVIAVIDSGFNTEHPAFSAEPPVPALRKSDIEKALGKEYAACYLSAKIPLALDYAGRGTPPTPDAHLKEEEAPDTDLHGISDRGTATASLAAGCYIGKGDVVREDDTVYHDADYRGTAPDAQLLLMKAAPDFSETVRADAAARAVLDAVLLKADAIFFDLTDVEINDALIAALQKAEQAHIPVFTGAGDADDAVLLAAARLSASVVDRGTLTGAASLPGVIAVGAAADPTASILSFKAGEREIFYNDSSAEYLGSPFAAYFAGTTVPVAVIPGFGRAADYAGTDVTDKLAVVLRGEIPFTEKAQYAAEAGAAGLIVVNTEAGTARMALSGTEIPAVMISPEDGAFLTGEDAPDSVTFAPAAAGAAAFSARGLTSDFDAAVSFITAGEYLTAAVGSGWDVRSGTRYAAARAAGFCAAAAEYLHKSGSSAVSAAVYLAAAARPLRGEDRLPLSARTVGAGMVDKDCVLPETVITDGDGRAVTVPAPDSENTVISVLRVTNTSDRPIRYAVTAEITTDETDGYGKLTGRTVRAPGLYVTAGIGGENLAEGGKTYLTVAPGRTEDLYFRVSITYETRRALSVHAPYGFYLDAAVTLTEESLTPGLTGPTLGPSVTPGRPGAGVTHAVSLFWGDLSLAPLADSTVFDGTDAILLHTVPAAYSAAAGYASVIGIPDPLSGTGWDEAYNIVNPRMLQDGWLELRLTALRDIESVTVRFLDADGRLLIERDAGKAERYLTAGGRATVALWDFTAADAPEYVFPDGTYSCEIRLTAMDGAAVQYLGFSVTADSEKPAVTDVTFHQTEDGRRLMTVTASDNRALSSVQVYDLSRSYAAAETDSVSGKAAVSLTFDITGYDGDGPLYAEAVDYAGSSAVRRFTAAQIGKALEDQP